MDKIKALAEYYKGLKIPRLSSRTGSSPVFGTRFHSTDIQHFTADDKFQIPCDFGRKGQNQCAKINPYKPTLTHKRGCPKGMGKGDAHRPQKRAIYFV
jgi:hypothetical protein